MATDGAFFPVSYYFQLSFANSKNDADASFKEASGISVEVETQEQVCGGENRFKYKLPGVAKYNNLVLKRGLIPKKSGLTKWLNESLGGGLAKPMQPTDITLMLLYDKSTPLVVWKFVRAYPVKWSISDFNSMENNLAIESLEFAYTLFTKREP